MKTWNSNRFRGWKSLDEPLSFFGIKGRFMIVFVLVGAFAGMVSLALGNTFGRFITLTFLAAALVGDYMLIQVLQNRYTEREFARMLTKNRMRMHIKVLPEGLESLMEEPRDADEDTV